MISWGCVISGQSKFMYYTFYSSWKWKQKTKTKGVKCNLDATLMDYKGLSFFLSSFIIILFFMLTYQDHLMVWLTHHRIGLDLLILMSSFLVYFNLERNKKKSQNILEMRCHPEPQKMRLQQDMPFFLFPPSPYTGIDFRLFFSWLIHIWIAASRKCV